MNSVWTDINEKYQHYGYKMEESIATKFTLNPKPQGLDGWNAHGTTNYNTHSAKISTTNLLKQ